jgi:hypothetical protein
VLQQAGRIDMAIQALAVPGANTVAKGCRRGSFVKPDAQASGTDKSLERISSASPTKVKQRAQTVCSKNNRFQLTSLKSSTESFLQPPVSTSPSCLESPRLPALPTLDRPGGQPLFRIPHFVFDKVWKWIGWNWLEQSKQFCKI